MAGLEAAEFAQWLGGVAPTTIEYVNESNVIHSTVAVGRSSFSPSSQSTPKTSMLAPRLRCS